MTIKSQKGFTLIELLVVIAIIGILATIVLTSLGSARSKASDSKIQSQLSSLRSQAELYYNSATGGNFTYGPVLAAAVTSTASNGCNTAGTMFQTASGGTTNGMNDIVDSLYTIVGTGNLYCGSAGSAWMVASQSPTTAGTYFCADSSGASKKYTGVGTAAGTVYAAASPYLCI